MNNKKTIRSWAMYDWANSVYNLVITSTIFPAYFEAVTGDHNDKTEIDYISFFGFSFQNTALYNFAIAFALLIVAISLPLLSSIADYKGNKKKFLSLFSLLGSIACMSLFFFSGRDMLWMGILGMVFACITYWSSLVFYNSYLPEIATVDQRDQVSAKGFSYGYIGSVILQILCFVFVFNPGLVGGVKDETNIQYQVCFLLVGAWWLIFSRISIKGLPNGTPLYTDKPENIISAGYKELRIVAKEIGKNPLLKKYLTSFFFLSMGVQTVMLAATLYGKKDLAIPTENLIISILIIQLVAIGGAFLIANLSKRFGNLPVLIGCAIFWIGLCIVGYKLKSGDVNSFYALAFGVGLVMGGVQSLTRSTFAKFMPETHDTTSYFSFYDVTEKIAIVIGMFSFGAITQLTGSQRNSVLALTVFFVLAVVFLFLAKMEKDKMELSKN